MVIDIDLEPCPFCGGKAVGEYKTQFGERFYYLICNGKFCDIKPCTFNYNEGEEHKAIVAWNKRK